MPVEAKHCLCCGSELTTREIGESQRLTCSADDCDWVHWDSPIPVVAAIVEIDGEVILAHNKLWPPSWYGLVTGFLEKRETPKQGVVREVLEELGVEATQVNFVGHYPFEQMNQILIAYHVEASGDITLGDELDDYKRVPVDKLRPWPFGTGDAVRDWLASRQPSPGAG